MSAVLVRRAYEKHSDGRWYTHWFVAYNNPTLETPFFHEARTFGSVALARVAKKALALPRALAARAVPEWLK